MMGCEFFSRSKIVAGKNGLENMVTHVTTLDSPDAYNYFKGGEFVITTGYSFLNDLVYQKELVKKLVTKGVAGLGITLRYFDNKLPECIKMEADNLDFPIISLPNEDSYADIYEFITTYLVSKTTREIKTINETYKEIGQNLYEKGFPGIIQSLYKWTGLQAGIIINNEIHTYPEDSLLEYFPTDSSLWKKKAFQNKINSNIDCYCWESGGIYLEWICSEIVYNYQVKGYILLFKKQKYKYVPIDACLLLDYSLLVCSLEVRKIETMGDTNRRFKKEFLHRFVSNQLPSVELKKQAALFNYYLVDEGLIILIKGVEEEYIDRAISNIYTKHTIFGMLEDDLAVIYVENSEKYENDINRLYVKLRSNYNLKNVIIGVGTVVNLDSIKQSYDEAKCSLEIGCYLKNDPNIYYFTQLGFYQLLKISSITNEMQRYCEKYIKPLESQGEENYKNFIKTIECYIKNAYSFKETATELFVHPNTVRYRITTVEKLCNINFKYANDRLNMEVTLKILPLITKKDI